MGVNHASSLLLSATSTTCVDCLAPGHAVDCSHGSPSLSPPAGVPGLFCHAASQEIKCYRCCIEPVDLRQQRFCSVSIIRRACAGVCATRGGVGSAALLFLQLQYPSLHSISWVALHKCPSHRKGAGHAMPHLSVRRWVQLTGMAMAAVFVEVCMWTREPCIVVVAVLSAGALPGGCGWLTARTRCYRSRKVVLADSPLGQLHSDVACTSSRQLLRTQEIFSCPSPYLHRSALSGRCRGGELHCGRLAKHEASSTAHYTRVCNI